MKKKTDLCCVWLRQCVNVSRAAMFLLPIHHLVLLSHEDVNHLIWNIKTLIDLTIESPRPFGKEKPIWETKSPKKHFNLRNQIFRFGNLSLIWEIKNPILEIKIPFEKSKTPSLGIKSPFEKLTPHLRTQKKPVWNQNSSCAIKRTNFGN